jgi:hypothetical protein
MPVIDRVVLVSVVLGCIGLGVRLWRRGARRRLLASAIVAGSYGVVLTVSMAAHIVDILWRWYVGHTYAGTPLVYDFRLYSLLLLGVALIACGMSLLRAADALASGEVRGRGSAAAAAACALAIVLPLIPIQSFFAVPLSVLGALVLLLLAGTPARRFSQGSA